MARGLLFECLHCVSLYSRMCVSFWRQFKSDMATSASLNDYYCHRLQREDEVKRLSGQKRKEMDAVKCVQTQRKKRRLSVEKLDENHRMKVMEEESSLCSFNYPSAMLVCSENHANDEKEEANLMSDLLKNERKRNEKLMQLLCDAEIKSNQIINDKTRKIKELKLQKHDLERENECVLMTMDALKRKNESFIKNVTLYFIWGIRLSDVCCFL